MIKFRKACDREWRPLSQAWAIALVNRAKSPLAIAYFEQIRPREKEILRLLSEGRSTKEITENLVINPSTVQSHRSNLMIKFGLSKPHELIQYARQRGLTRREKQSEKPRFTKRQFPRGKRQWIWRFLYLGWRLAQYPTAILYTYAVNAESVEELNLRKADWVFSGQ